MFAVEFVDAWQVAWTFRLSRVVRLIRVVVTCCVLVACVNYIALSATFVYVNFQVRSGFHGPLRKSCWHGLELNLGLVLLQCGK